MKIDTRGKIGSNFFACEVLVRGNLMQFKYLFTPQEAEIIGNSRQSSSVVNSLGSFFYGAPQKFLLFVAFLPSPPLPRMINFKKPYLFALPGHTNHEKATCIVSSNLCLFTCPQATGFPRNLYPQRHINAKRVFLKFIPVFLMLTFQIIYQYPRCESI